MVRFRSIFYGHLNLPEVIPESGHKAGVSPEHDQMYLNNNNSNESHKKQQKKELNTSTKEPYKGSTSA